MAKTITVEGDLAAADTLYRLTTQGSVTAPSLVVPQGVTKIARVIASAVIVGAADDGMIAFFIRLGGAAVRNGESQIFIGGAGNQTVQTGSDAAPCFVSNFVLDDADIEINAGDSITISAEGSGVDAGTGYVSVTLIYA
ncbi:MAG: hypothetical protein AAB456_04335 [Patescibacteria group bacterium]